MDISPSQKAEELINRFIPFVVWQFDGNDEVTFLVNAKKCAVITVNELIQNDKGSDTDYVSGLGYWQQVKTEIETYEI